MLSDFLTIEAYFGSQNAALYFEDLVKRYGQKRAQQAILNGDLRCSHPSLCANQNHARPLTWLSEQGRSKAEAIHS